MSHTTRSTRMNMERLSRDGIRSTTGYDNVPVTYKVSELLQKLWGDEWHTHRLAYGAQEDDQKPTQLKWVSNTINAQYDPTIQELFADITLTEPEKYYLLISKLDVNIIHTHSDNPQWYEALQKERVKGALDRFQDLYTRTSLTAHDGAAAPKGSNSSMSVSSLLSRLSSLLE